MDGAEVSGIDFNRRAGQKTPFYLDALICEPDFAAKLKSGAQDGSKCLTCNGCYTIYRKRFVRCVQHRAVQNHPVVKKNGRAGAFCAGSVFTVR